VKTSVSARLDETLIRFLDEYQEQYQIPTRSEALEVAIKALREQQLKREYTLAMREWVASEDAELWDVTAGDGLEPDAAG
jgi:metal-responsive CopG/Arc/MetJ family transcriptional regulator